ncbi:carbonic anhydrase [Methyloprofundus sp.]|uniref:carbonic anhydrase n=1 Tax=Methyloprofundus sp. TaxID=2020875 RepID=UPI003D1221CC
MTARSITKQQSPEYLWIGCSASRVSVNQIIDLAPGAVFVQRNIANVMVHTDLSCLLVIQSAVEALKVCGGIKATFNIE